jgi:hypothetical protein
MIKSPKSILEILRTWYQGPVPNIVELTVLWEDEVIVSLRWKEEGGKTNQTKAIRSGRGWVLNPKPVEG